MDVSGSVDRRFEPVREAFAGIRPHELVLRAEDRAGRRIR